MQLAPGTGGEHPKATQRAGAAVTERSRPPEEPIPTDALTARDRASLSERLQREVAALIGVREA